MCLTSIISKFKLPEGVSILISSSTNLPTNPFAIGVSIDISPLSGSDSKFPTILKTISLSLSQS